MEIKDKHDPLHFEEHLGEKEVIVDTEVAGYTDSTVVIDEATNKRLLWYAHTRILPLLCLGYLMQALDKNTTSLASIMGLQKDTGMVGQDYALTSTALWIGIIAGEFPANRLIQLFPLAKLLSGSMVIWGVVLLGLSFSRHSHTIIGLRFLLGFLESVCGPTLLSITVMWFKKTEQPFVTSSWQMMLGLNSIIGGILGWAFYHVHNQKLYGWQYLGIGIAGLSMVSGIFIGFTLPDSPVKARVSEQDKVLFVERVRSNDQGIKNTQFKKEQAIECFKDPFVWLLFLTILFNTLVVGGINTFSAILINGNFGFDVLTAQLLNIPIGTLLILLYQLAAYLSRKTNQTYYVMLGFLIPNIAGTIVLITVPSTPSTKGGLLVAFYCMQFFQATNPLIFLQLSRNIAGATKKNIAYSLVFIGWAGGNAAASQLFRSKWAPRYLNSLYIHLGLYVCFATTVLISRTLLVHRNKQKTEFRRAIEEDSVVAGDSHLNAFSDLTDLENPDFTYVY